MNYLDTRFVIAGTLRRYAEITGSPVLRSEDGFDAIEAIRPEPMVSGSQGRFELFEYANAPDGANIHILSTHPDYMQDLVQLLLWLGVTPNEIDCERDIHGRPLVNIDWVCQALAVTTPTVSPLPATSPPPQVCRLDGCSLT